MSPSVASPRLHTSRAPFALLPSRRLALAVAATLITLGSARADDLLQIYDAALGYDPVYQSALKAYEAAAQKVPQARAGLLPSAALTGSASLVTAESKTGPLNLDATYNSASVGLGGSMPLFRPANEAAFEQAKLALQVAEQTRKLAEQDLITRVAKAYFDVLAAQDNLAFARAQKQAVAEQLASAKRNFEVGTATITDTRETQARFDLVTAQEIAADSDLAIKRLALQQLTGKAPPPLKPLAAKPVLPSPEPDSLDAWVQRALDGNPGLVQAKLAEQVAKFETERARAAGKPTVDLTASVGLNRQSKSLTSNFSTRSSSGSIGVSVNWPVYTGGAVQARIAETLALEDKARNDTAGAAAALSQGARQAYLGLKSGLAQVKALEAAELSSQSALDANKLGYQVGVRINIDVLNSQSQLFQTKRDLSKARYDVLTGTLSLKALTGELTRDGLAQINALLADPPTTPPAPATPSAPNRPSSSLLPGMDGAPPAAAATATQAASAGRVGSGDGPAPAKPASSADSATSGTPRTGVAATFTAVTPAQPASRLLASSSSSNTDK